MWICYRHRYTLSLLEKCKGNTSVSWSRWCQEAYPRQRCNYLAYVSGRSKAVWSYYSSWIRWSSVTFSVIYFCHVNDSCVDPLDYRLTPPPVDEEGILRMYACDKHSSTSFSCRLFYNIECNRQPIHYPRRHHGPCSSRKRTAERGRVWWQRGNLLIFHSCLNM